jgi:hypothetical protein
MRALAAVILFENAGVMANFLENPLLRVVETRMQKIGQISAAILNWRHPQALSLSVRILYTCLHWKNYSLRWDEQPTRGTTESWQG